MAERAQVISLEALETFRARLIIYLKKARPVLEEITEDVRRTRVWLQTDRQHHWQQESKRCRREWEQAQQELFSAKMSTFRGSTSAQQLAVNRARRAWENAEDKLRRVKQWNRQFENLTDPLVKQLGPLHGLLISDLPKAVAYLAQVIKTLEAYAESHAPAPPANPPPENHLDDSRPPAEAQATVAAPPSDNKRERLTTDQTP